MGGIKAGIDSSVWSLSPLMVWPQFLSLLKQISLPTCFLPSCPFPFLGPLFTVSPIGNTLPYVHPILAIIEALSPVPSFFCVGFFFFFFAKSFLNISNDFSVV